MRERLSEEKDISLRIELEQIFLKAVVIAAGSEMEQELTKTIIQLVSDASKSPWVAEFVRIKALTRQYHTLFDWKKQSPNTFWSLFGPEIAGKLKVRYQGDEAFQAIVDAFLRLGSKRNSIAHAYFEFSLELGLEEFMAEYELAREFPGRFSGVLIEILAQPEAHPSA